MHQYAQRRTHKYMRTCVRVCRYLVLPHKLHPVRCGSTIFSKTVPEHVVHLQADEPRDLPSAGPAAALAEHPAVSSLASLVAENRGASSTSRKASLNAILIKLSSIRRRCTRRQKSVHSIAINFDSYSLVQKHNKMWIYKTIIYQITQLG